MKTKLIITAALAVLLSSASSYAATIAGVTIEAFSSERGGFNRFAVNTVDGDQGTNWQTNNDSDKTITYDLGQVYAVDSFTLWNYTGTDQSDVEDVLVTYGETTGLGSTLDTFTFALSSGTAGQERAFPTISARYIKFDIATMHSGDASLSSTRAGFAEIEFSAVPEPTTATLLGVIGLALILRRRR